MSSIYDFSDQIYDTVTESIAINEKDIYYNKDKFDSGEINLCFITGLSVNEKSYTSIKKSFINIIGYLSYEELDAYKELLESEKLKRDANSKINKYL